MTGPGNIPCKFIIHTVGASYNSSDVSKSKKVEMYGYNVCYSILHGRIKGQKCTLFPYKHCSVLYFDQQCFMKLQSLVMHGALCIELFMPL